MRFHNNGINKSDCFVDKAINKLDFMMDNHSHWIHDKSRDKFESLTLGGLDLI